MRPLAVLVALLLTAPAQAEEIVLGLSQDEVAITATFQGSEITVYGAVARSAPIPDGALDVIVAVSGPRIPAIVRTKARRFGIWVNVESAEIDAAPSFYAVATTGPLAEVLSATDDLRYSISLPSVIRSVDAGVADSVPFTDALIRIRTGEGLYQILEGAVDFEARTLFRTEITLPANLIEGNYTTRIFLTRSGEVIDTYSTVIGVQKVGLERWLYNLAHEQAAVYGALSLLIAIAAGWLASAAFTGFRR